MKICVDSTKFSFEDKKKILHEYPCLNNYNPEIIKKEKDNVLYIEINSLQELFDLSHEINEELIIDNPEGNFPCIEIYDYYRE